MGTLSSWKCSTSGWRIGSTQDDTKGLSQTDSVIYKKIGTDQYVQRQPLTSTTASNWGKITKDTGTTLMGHTVATPSLSFTIECQNGILTGRLSTPSSPATLGVAPAEAQQSYPGDDDPPPGSWTADEGGDVGGPRRPKNPPPKPGPL
ncbi:MAG TPA: hypothetical protein VE685_22800 [Thermoanaerobaculia bacterium]|nr:hypothetical protein [Thermoanaerobaculia bacterium]